MGQPAPGTQAGEPTPPLIVDPPEASPGDVVRIVLVGPPGGVAMVDFTLIPPPPAAATPGP